MNPYAEEVWVLALTTQLQLIKMEMISRGTADHSLLHPRDIMRVLVLNNATSFILGHNHPSNQAMPSGQDLVITRQIHQLAKLVQIPLNDHIIFTADTYFSMNDNGYFKNGVNKITNGRQQNHQKVACRSFV